MRLPSALRTASFRLTLLFAASLCLSFVALSGVIFWSATDFLLHQIDDSVMGEIAEIQTDTGQGSIGIMAKVVTALAGKSPEFYYLLQDARGAVLAGNLPAMRPEIGIQEYPKPSGSRFDKAGILRGRGVHLANGGYLFVALGTTVAQQMKQTVWHALTWGVLGAIVLSVLGGAVIGRILLRRMEALSRTARSIVEGDLRRRIPLGGSGDEFDHLATSLNAMLERIETLMGGMRQVSNDIAHDLRTPLTRLRQRIELALRRPVDGDALRAVLERTLSDVDSILETFSALLRIAQVDSSVHRARFTTVDLSDVLRTAVEVYLPTATEKGQSVGEAIDHGLAVWGDRELLLQLFANLIENAIRHTPPSSAIEIRATRQPDRVEVIVSDDGPGIPDGDRDRVFKPFVRLDASRSTPGNGLGLSLVSSILSLHQAAIVLSDNGPGLRITITLSASLVSLPVPRDGRVMGGDESADAA